MIKVIITVMCFYSLYSMAGIREDFHKDSNSETGLLNIIDGNNYPKTSLTKGYKGLSETMMAEHVFWPSSKLSYFKKGKEKVESAITDNPKNCELRYIRMLIQLNAPSFLNYNKSIDKDFEYFKTNIAKANLDKKWKIKFVEVLLTTKKLSSSQKKELEKIKYQFNG